MPSLVHLTGCSDFLCQGLGQTPGIPRGCGQGPPLLVGKAGGEPACIIGVRAAMGPEGLTGGVSAWTGWSGTSLPWLVWNGKQNMASRGACFHSLGAPSVCPSPRTPMSSRRMQTASRAPGPEAVARAAVGGAAFRVCSARTGSLGGAAHPLFTRPLKTLLRISKFN